ncbi:site-specific DNA-methyltransferase [Ligilactobacillus saerimneri]|uniref:Site-specific DNA-methyltransferase n=1 Tax=Ligilactobacillus saerimneri TaxID=228229 RepID=A0A7H9ELD4_9LACO|nr:site-specific DNA-methyltransferase [Ligilactobacillus saerimneri]QLL77985.1 site-specific DNA-methyltransferase [Ligilactobacillus saerimneri]
MAVEAKIIDHIRTVLEAFGTTYLTENGALKKNKLINDLDKYNKELMMALLADEFIRKTYTEKIADVEVFKVNQFVEMLEYKSYWEDSYTKYSNKIGLTAGGKFIDEATDVVLDFPYKDTVLKAGMTKEDLDKTDDADEPFLNEVLAKAEIDELLEPKVLVNAKRYDVNGVADATSINDTDNLIIKGNNLLALHSLKERYAGKVKLIYLDPPYNTGNDSFQYNDRFNHATWLTFMKNRIELAQELLSNDGHIIIQTDDNEQAYLKVLMDSIFGQNNYVNTISVLFKNIAGASGGGEDKRLKKNIEYLTIYAKNYEYSRPFNDVYDLKEVSKLVKEMRENGVSWKYTSVLTNPGIPEYIGSTVDGAGNEIKLFKRNNFEIKSISKLMKENNLTEEEAYSKYGNQAFQTAMPQSSIRPTVMEKYNEIESNPNELMSIKYVPRTGRNKGKVYEQFYKGPKFRLFAWLKDVSIEKNGHLFKAEKQGTFWNFVGSTKNVNKEGKVAFPNGKKPEELLSRIIKMTTDKDMK